MLALCAHLTSEWTVQPTPPSARLSRHSTQGVQGTRHEALNQRGTDGWDLCAAACRMPSSFSFGGACSWTRVRIWNNHGYCSLKEPCAAACREHSSTSFYGAYSWTRAGIPSIHGSLFLMELCALLQAEGFQATSAFPLCEKKELTLLLADKTQPGEKSNLLSTQQT